MGLMNHYCNSKWVAGDLTPSCDYGGASRADKLHFCGRSEIDRCLETSTSNPCRLGNLWLKTRYINFESVYFNDSFYPLFHPLDRE